MQFCDLPVKRRFIFAFKQDIYMYLIFFLFLLFTIKSKLSRRENQKGFFCLSGNGEATSQTGSLLVKPSDLASLNLYQLVGIGKKTFTSER